jgi:peptide subunit release factor 1 (eRF1)
MITKDLKDSSTLNQFQFEIHSWIRLVEFLNQENTYLKNRLSEVIDQIKDIENLALAEHFQNQFIVKDDVYDHILHNLKKQAHEWREIKMVTSKDIRDELAKTQKNLRDQIEFIERDYALMTKDYNTYLAALSIND